MQPETVTRNPRLALLILAVALALGAAMPSLAGGDKIEICHFPPGNPGNFHTITINQNAWTAHQANHNDLLGSCVANCETICGDGNACTQDIQSDPDACICLPDHPPVDCDDGLACTDDNCDPATGCSNVESCGDGNECTADICPDLAPGTCQYPPVTDGTECITDGDGAGECQSGVCVEVDLCADAPPCPPSDPTGCEVSLGCQDGVCVYETSPDGTGCGDISTVPGGGYTGECQNGVCIEP